MTLNSTFFGKTFASRYVRSGNRFISYGAGIILALLLVTTELQAQCPSCPTDIPPFGTGSPAWTSASTSITTLSGCIITICYCFRDCPDVPTIGSHTYQTVMTDVFIPSNLACSGISLTEDILTLIHL